MNFIVGLLTILSLVFISLAPYKNVNFLNTYLFLGGIGILWFFMLFAVFKVNPFDVDSTYKGDKLCILRDYIEENQLIVIIALISIAVIVGMAGIFAFKYNNASVFGVGDNTLDVLATAIVTSSIEELFFTVNIGLTAYLCWLYLTNSRLLSLVLASILTGVGAGIFHYFTYGFIMSDLYGAVGFFTMSTCVYLLVGNNLLGNVGHFLHNYIVFN